MYPLYGIKKPSIPLRHNTPPIKFLSGRILNPISVKNSSVWADICNPVSTSAVISTPCSITIAWLAWPSSCTKDQGCDTWILLPVCWYLPMSLAPLHLAAHLRRQRLEAPATSPNFHLKGCLDTYELNVPNPLIENIWSHFGHVPHDYFDCCLDPLHYVDFYYHSLHFPTVEGYWLWFSVAPALPLTAAWFALSDLQCHPSPLTELISLRLPPQVSPLAIDSALWAAVMSWGYIIPISSYR